jgi:hypothetical protein
MSRMTTFEDVSKVFSYNPQTGIVRWASDVSPLRLAGQPVSSKTTGGYITVIVGGYGYKAHRIAWMLTHGEWPKYEIDHINGERADNRLANLRDVTHQVNQMNQRCHRTTKSTSCTLCGATGHSAHQCKWGQQ